jgi:hypothetical protein
MCKPSAEGSLLRLTGSDIPASNHLPYRGFHEPKGRYPDLAGDGLWHVLELDAPDALVRRKFSVDMGENRIGSGMIRDPSRR